MYCFNLLSNLRKRTSDLFDPSRIGSLLQSGDHAYSRQEILDRSMIGTAAVLGGFLAYRASSRRTNSVLVNASATTLGATVFLALGHIPVIYPLVHKRYQMKNEFEQLTSEIHANATRLNISLEKVNQVIDKLKDCNLADAKKSNTSQTLGRRNTILKELNQIVIDRGSDANLIESLLDDLLKDKTLESVYKRELEIAAVLSTTKSFKL